MTTGEEQARRVFAAFQAAVDTWVPAEVVGRCSSDVVWIGTASYSVGAEEMDDYVRDVFARNETMRWELGRYDVFLDAPPLLGFAARGEIVALTGGTGQRHPFRVTVVAEGEVIRHFHGSVPMGAFTPVPRRVAAPASPGA